MADTETLEQPQPATAPTLEVDEFSSLLTKEFRPRSDRAREEVDRAVRTLAEQALAETVVVSSDTIKTIESIIAAIDRKLSEQVNLVMHHPDFQQLEFDLTHERAVVIGNGNVALDVARIGAE